MRLSGQPQTSLFFFMKRFRAYKNTNQTKTNQFSLSVFMREKLLPLLLLVRLILFCWLVLV